MPGPVIMNQGLIPNGYQQLTGIAAATAPTIPAGTTCAYVRPSVQAVRWRDDGTDPTAAVGQLQPANEERFFMTSMLARLKFIEVVAGAVVDITYYKL